MLIKIQKMVSNLHNLNYECIEHLFRFINFNDINNLKLSNSVNLSVLNENIGHLRKSVRRICLDKLCVIKDANGKIIKKISINALTYDEEVKMILKACGKNVQALGIRISEHNQFLNYRNYFKYAASFSKNTKLFVFFVKMDYNLRNGQKQNLTLLLINYLKKNKQLTTLFLKNFYINNMFIKNFLRYLDEVDKFEFFFSYDTKFETKRCLKVFIDNLNKRKITHHVSM